nr:MAG TPA: hypothetical protein [Caudoviricetes sp.]
MKLIFVHAMKKDRKLLQKHKCIFIKLNTNFV